MTTTWKISLISDITANDSDKIFTVPVNVEWEILWIWVEYSSSATGGNRQLEVQFQNDTGDVIASWQAGITQPEGLNYNYLFSTGIPDLTAVRDMNYLTTPLMGNSFLSAGQKIRIWDNNAVDPTADDMSIQIQYGYHDSI
jgi:hypothetical protein